MDMNMAVKGSVAAQPGIQTPLASYAGEFSRLTLLTHDLILRVCASPNGRLVVVWKTHWFAFTHLTTHFPILLYGNITGWF